MLKMADHSYLCTISTLFVNTLYQQAVMSIFLKISLLLLCFFAPVRAQAQNPANITGNKDAQVETEIKRLREENRLLLETVIVLQQEVKTLRFEFKLGLLEIKLEREQHTEEQFSKDRKEIEESLANLKVDFEQAESPEEKTRIEAEEQKLLIERLDVLNEIEKAGKRVDELKNEIEKTKGILQTLKTTTRQFPLSHRGEGITR